MEMIEVMGLDGNDYADRCHAPNFGILSVRFPVDDLETVTTTLSERNWPASVAREFAIEPYGRQRVLNVRTPDGSTIQFLQRVAEGDQ